MSTFSHLSTGNSVTLFILGIYTAILCIIILYHIFASIFIKQKYIHCQSLYLVLIGSLVSVDLFFDIVNIHFIDNIAWIDELILVISFSIYVIGYIAWKNTILNYIQFFLFSLLLLPFVFEHSISVIDLFHLDWLQDSKVKFLFTSIWVIFLLFTYIAYQFYLLWQKANSDQAATQAKTDFLANMSHEIRTPLNAIIGMGDLLETANLKQEERNYLNILRSASKNLISLVNDILDLSKIEAGKIELEELLFSPEALIKDTVRFIAPGAHNKGLPLYCNVSQDLPLYCKGEATRLRQILVNLTNNAIKFTEKGYIQIDAEACPTNIFMDIYPDSTMDPNVCYLLLSIKDTGVGIPMGKWEKIFNSFSQADPSTTRRFGGSGLGLAITRSLIEIMRGRIWVESIESRGSTFYCLLPFEIISETVVYSINEQNKNQAENQVKDPSIKALEILLVEDNIDNQVLFHAYMKKTNHKIEIANNGQEAFKAICKKNFDLVFMDIQMPILDGISATRKIRKWEQKRLKNQKNKPTQIYALTAHAFKEEIEKTKNAGCDGHITKPLKKTELFEIIDRHAA